MLLGMWSKGNPCTLVVRISLGAATTENSTEIPPKLRRAPPYNLAITLLGIYPKKMKTLIGRDTYTPMFTAASFIVTKIWKQHKCPSTDKWVKKLWYKYTMK